MFACIHGPGVPLDLASTFSPRVEQVTADTLVLDLAGLDRLFGSPGEVAHVIAGRLAALGVQANVAIAANVDAATHAARGLAGVTIIPPGEEAVLLGNLPVKLLSPPPEIAETLELWGVRSFAGLAALPEDGVAARLGPEGVRLQRLARGACDRLLVTASPQPVFEESMELEHPLELLEPLLFLLGRLLQQLTKRLEAWGLGALELHLHLRLENQAEHSRTLRFPVPMRDSRTFLKLLQLDLETHPPPAPILAVSLNAEPLPPRSVQHGLFIPLAPEPQKLEVTLARIAKLVGEGNAGAPELLDTHRPDAFRVTRFTAANAGAPRNGSGIAPRLALRMFRPPLPARVKTSGGRPRCIAARGLSGTVVSLAGPWRTSGDWWTPHPWAHDEFDVALSDGSLYRIYQESESGRWFIEGRYD